MINIIQYSMYVLMVEFVTNCEVHNRLPSVSKEYALQHALIQSK